MATGLVPKIDCLQRKQLEFICRGHKIPLGATTKVMGILNVTSDSFSGDGIFQDPQRAKARCLEMETEGADIIDIGGESTRPGAQSVPAQEQIKRVVSVIRAIKKESQIPISIDTTKSEVAKAALEEGASIVNDISAFRFDVKMADTVARYDAGCVLMHIQGTPDTMQEHPFYSALIEEIIQSLQAGIAQAIKAGIKKEQIVIDPGIGFGKTTAHNLEIIKRLSDFSCLNLPVLIGPSRKSFIGNVLNLEVEKRLFGTAAAVAAGLLHGAHIVRVHDVKEIVQVAKMIDAVLNA